MMPSRRGLAAGLLLGAALDAVLADPRRAHPVAAFGAAAAALAAVIAHILCRGRKP
jgi:cobalamin biosynthesis protein CobD/CbiB